MCSTYLVTFKPFSITFGKFIVIKHSQMYKNRRSMNVRTSYIWNGNFEIWTFLTLQFHEMQILHFPKCKNIIFRKCRNHTRDSSFHIWQYSIYICWNCSHCQNQSFHRSRGQKFNVADIPTQTVIFLEWRGLSKLKSGLELFQMRSFCRLGTPSR